MAAQEQPLQRQPFEIDNAIWQGWIDLVISNACYIRERYPQDVEKMRAVIQDGMEDTITQVVKYHRKK